MEKLSEGSSLKNMTTPELLEYVRVEIGKGKTREEIHATLISGGGWNETDLSEAFSVPLPTLPDALEPSIGNGAVGTRQLQAPGSLIFIIFGLFCIVSWYFYSPQITNVWNRGIKSSQELSVNSWNSLEEFSMNFWNSSVNNLKTISFPVLKLPTFSLPSFDFQLPTFSLPSFDFQLPTFSWPSLNFSFLNKGKDIVPSAPIENNINNAIESTPIASPAVAQVKDCGIGVTPKLDNPSTYKNDPTLSCLGAGALNCENVKGVLKDDFFPTIFEIAKLQDSCNFKLSYSADSALTDITGKKLALQYISCPINIVKAIDNTKPATTRFIAPDKTDLSKYASQIYFYGTLGLFIENNLDQNKIQGLGCEGGYIQSVIASYNLSQKK